MTGAERAERARRVRESRRPAAPAAADDTAEPPPPAARAGYVRTDPVRSTVDLPPTHHAQLGTWADELSVQLGLAPGRRGVTRQAVLAALVAELLVDATIQGRVAKRLRRVYGEKS